MRGDGDFVVAWESSQEGIDTGVYAQRVKKVATIDVDGDGATMALTDGILMLRHRFGFTGINLTSGAVGDECTRCDAGAIAAYIEGSS